MNFIDAMRKTLNAIKGYTSKTYSNALKGKSSGTVVSLSDVSPIEHKILVKLRGENLPDDTEVPVKSCGKNLYDIRKAKPYSTGTITLGENQFTYTGTYYVSYPIRLTEGSYIMSYGCETDAPSAPTWRIAYEDGTYSSMAQAGSKISIPSGKVCKQILLYAVTTNAVYTTTYKNIQLEQGKIATAYEPYKEGEAIITTIAEGAELTSIAPTMKIITDTSEVVINVEYNRDINKVISQTTGISENVVMSQKATSENFANAIKGRLYSSYPYIDDYSSVTHPITLRACSINMLPYPYVDEGKTKNGVTMTRGEDGEIIFNGTATAVIHFILCRGTLGIDDISEPVEVNTSTVFYECQYSQRSLGLHRKDNRSDTNVALQSSGNIYIRIKQGTVFDGTNASTYRPIITWDAGDAMSYVPYRTDFTGCEADISIQSLTTYDDWDGLENKVLDLSTPVTISSPPAGYSIQLMTRDYGWAIEVEYVKDTQKTIEALLQPLKDAIISLGGNV